MLDLTCRHTRTAPPGGSSSRGFRKFTGQRSITPMPESAFDTYAYAREVLLPSLRLESRPFVIQRPAAGGTSSRAFKVVIERAPTLLLRTFDDIGRARRAAAALRHLEERRMAAPRLMFADISWTNRFTRTNGLPRYAIAETWIDGQRALEAKDEAGTALMVAALLARFHSVSRSSWGRPGAVPDLRPYAATTLRLSAKMIRELAGRGVLSEGEAAEAKSRFESWRPALMRIGAFQLCLNDANRRNFIITEDAGLVAVDVERVSYEPCPEEVANALYHFCRRDENLAKRFLRAYLAAASRSARDIWDRTGDFFTVLNTLKRLHRRTGSDAAAIVHPDDTERGAPPGIDARIPEWRKALAGLGGPPKIWPEPGSAPPPETIGER